METQIKNFENIVNSYIDSIAILDSKGTILFVNNSWNEFYRNNCSGKEKNWIGENYLKFCVVAQEKSAMDACNGIMSVIEKKSRVFELEYPCHSPETERWFLLRVNPINDSENILVSHINITERVKAENKVEQQNQSLIRINHELQNLLAQIGHDIKNPLTSLNFLVNFLKSGDELNEINSYLELMEKNISGISEFIQEIMEVSENSRLNPVFEKINFRKTLQDITDGLKYMEGKDKVEIRNNISVETEFHSDVRLLKTILTNLISNAARYHDPEKEHPYVRTHIQTNQHDCVISVEDNGCGIPENEIEKIFTLHYRIKKDKPGTGLGLYLVKQALEKLEGKVEVKSQPGVGSTFICTIPNKKPGISN
ncbi:MAG: ATP-binding protein [Cytophagaceae bacterium]